MENYLNVFFEKGRRPKLFSTRCSTGLVSKAGPELGTTQPQLVSSLSEINKWWVPSPYGKITQIKAIL